MAAKKVRNQHGGVLPLVAVSLVGLCGIGALGVDVGMIYYARQRAQNEIDAATLAGATYMPAYTTAAQAQVTSRINSIITASNTSGNPVIKVTVSFPTTITSDDGTQKTVTQGSAVKVDGYVNANLTFAQVVGYTPSSVDNTPISNTLSVPAHATDLSEHTNGAQASPLGVVGDNASSTDPDIAYMSDLLTTATNSVTPLPNTYQPAGLQSAGNGGKQVTLKSDTNAGSTIMAAGNFGALAIDQTGASSYQAALAVSSTSFVTIGESIQTEPGNIVGDTEKGLTSRVASTNTAFDHYASSYDEWFFGRSSYGVDTSMPSVTDPVTGVVHQYYKDPERQDKNDGHLMVVPVITTPGKNGRTDVTVLALAIFWVDTISNGNGGGDAAVGRFVSFKLLNSTGTTDPTIPGAGGITTALIG